MRIIKPSTLRRHMARHPTARAGLSAWLTLAGRAEWRSTVDGRRAFPHADAVTVASGRTVVVFNVAGNHFRLVVAIHYNTGRVYVREFMTHAAYSRDTWKGRH